ncbi:hypothetical protein M3196_00370 [Fictibacillus nanhaiensis]|uniref:hypothetical protein n=1 Tax=Fictibacillus nanhaiensis TaxID=742169 RepID=UPI00203E2244|nr:hypothetical protein [Fictibacillus nanhaiensis]MCM3730122.1 hypothetical protein [Fictibacillus nanhaiensis]
MRKVYCEILEWNYNHGNNIPIKNFAKGLANWMRIHESDYNGKWKEIDFASDLNKNLYHFLNETGLRISNVRGFAKDWYQKKRLFDELKKLNVSAEDKYGKVYLYDLNLVGDEVEEKKKSVINKFIYYVKSNGKLHVNALQPVININVGDSSRTVNFGIPKFELAELLEEREADIKKAGIEICSGTSIDYKEYIYIGK